MGKRKRLSSSGDAGCMSPFQNLITSAKHQDYSEAGSRFERTVEETLLESGCWALYAIRIPGYFPLTVSDSDSGHQRLELKLTSLATGYILLVGSLSVTGSAFFLYSYFTNILLASAEELKCFENTLIIVWSTILFMVIYTTYLRCSRIFYAKSSLTFWRGIVGMLESIVENGYALNGDYLRQVYKTAFTWTLIYQVASFVRIVLNVYSIYTTLQDPCLTPLESVAVYLDLFISFMLCYHVGYSIWLRFLITVFTMCVKLMHDELDKESAKLRIFSDGFGRHTLEDKQYSSSDPNTISSVLGHFGTEVRYRLNYVREEMASTEESRDIERMIHRTLATYTLIEEQMQRFNAQFGVTLILETFFTLLYLVTSIYCVESFFENDTIYALTQLIPVAIFSSAFFNLASEASFLSGRASGTLKKLESFFIPTSRPQLQVLQMKLLGLIARVADNPPTISASHFFNLNRHLLTSFIGTVTTYLVVLLQMRKPPPPGQKEYCMRNTTCLSNETLVCGQCVSPELF